jgi:hypothetical protein
MIKIFTITILLSFYTTVFSQENNTIGAFRFLEPYTHGIPLTKKFKDWQNYIQNADDFTYVTTDFRKYGLIYSNLISLKNYTAFDNMVDSMVLALQILALKDSVTHKRDTANHIQFFITFKKTVSKKSVDSVFKIMEIKMHDFFTENTIFKNKYSNGIKVQYAMNEADIIYPITLEKYYDEEIKKYVITLFINKRSAYNTKLKYILNQNLMVLCRWILCQTNEYWSATKIKSV